MSDLDDRLSLLYDFVTDLAERSCMGFRRALGLCPRCGAVPPDYLGVGDDWCPNHDQDEQD